MHMRGAVFVTLLALLTGGILTAPAVAARAKVSHHKFSHHTKVAAANFAKVAPADEYFGRLKMSILGVRNQLKDLSAKVAFNPDRAGDQLGAAGMVEDAIHDWEHKYPGDSWLPKSVYDLSQLYSSIHTPEGQLRATRTLRWLVNRYPRCAFAKAARTQISAQLTK